jgi:hypothetical protein
VSADAGQAAHTGRLAVIRFWAMGQKRYVATVNTAAAGSMQGGIDTYRRASGPFQALIRISAQNDGDMRGWFHLVSAIHADPDPPTCSGFAKKRLMGFEPTTFCMALGPSPRPEGIEYGGLQGFRGGATDGPDKQYAQMCADMQRFGNFGTEVPEIRNGGSILHFRPQPMRLFCEGRFS